MAVLTMHNNDQFSLFIASINGQDNVQSLKFHIKELFMTVK